MDIVKHTSDEKYICEHSHIRTRNNSPKINYSNKINDKPWGKEYIAFQNEKIGIWILHINKDQETSLHCHFKKDTILIPLVNSFKINLFDSFRILTTFDSLYVPRNTFHGLHSYADDSIIMEIEVYTDQVDYTDKNDLLRIKDIYGRDKTNYESSVTERIPSDNEAMSFHSIGEYKIGDTHVSVMKIKSLYDITTIYDRVILLEGVLFSNGNIITSGSFIDTRRDLSILSEYITILCLRNTDCDSIKKIIYSKNHLSDYLKFSYFNMSNKKIGLTCGCFDIIHHGHTTNLKTSRKYCDFLAVCLSSDKQIKRLKGEKRPINSISDRISMLVNFDFVDLVILYDETNDEFETELDNIMNIINPDIWFKGSDYTKDDILRKHPSLRKIKLIDIIPGKSTTNIIHRINN
jgi:rfaE bifunctional protein nucleotidyltransferase chain/domain